MEVLTNVIKDILVLAAAPAIFIYIFNAYKEFRKLNEERLSVLIALHAELTSLDMLICSRENQYLNFDSDDTENIFYPYISITLNYFSVFDNIASKFGLINNQTTIEQIIKCYVEVKGLFDDVKNLEYYAKMIVNTTSQTNVNQKAALINSYTLNLRSIVYGQLPKAKVLIKQSIQCINDEKNKIESNNTILGFLFF